MTDFEKFIKMAAYLFNRDGFWTCECCLWLDCDRRICDACERLAEKLKEGNYEQ